MNPVTFSTGSLITAIGYADEMAIALGGTMGSNVGWLILIGTAVLLLSIINYILRLLATLGSSNKGVKGIKLSHGEYDIFFGSNLVTKKEDQRLRSLAKKHGSLDNVPLGEIDHKEARRVKRLGLDK